MAISNQERVNKGMDLLRAGLAPFVSREIHAAVSAKALSMETIRRFTDDPMLANKQIVQWDAAALLKLMAETWNDAFAKTLGRANRSLVFELRDVRNKWAHQDAFSSDDADRALDSMTRLLASVSAPEADEVAKMKRDLRRIVYEEQLRNEKRKAGSSLVEPAAAANLKPWREVIAPHPDVASGSYQDAEFAADLWQVHLGEGNDEYRNPIEFFRRTYLTESLKQLLIGAAERLTGKGGDPVVQLQTNFGGGKTHSMLALYHLFGGTSPAELPGIGAVLAETSIAALPKVRRVVLVGNRISPGNPTTKPDGTVVRTLWGELAWQLGGKQAFAKIAADDEKATSPGDRLRELFIDFGPCLVLIDEWVAYARQLHERNDLPGGSFETQFTFAQALTESAKLAKNCLLVVALPASDTGSPYSDADDVEVGGIRGREALDRLRNVVGRVESSWRPATAEEGFEIVRRRLFEPITADMYPSRDLTARAFSELYHAHSGEFPTECRGSDYEKRIRAAYPIHPEILDRLYGDWSTLVKFQRTRGVLRLMASVIHSLWERGDKSPLILPSSIPIDDGRVRSELTRYLSDNWSPIIEQDVDGPNSLPVKIDNDVGNLGKVSATRRVARTIYLGSAPSAGSAHRGLEDLRVKLGCVMPGESAAIFGDALRHLAAAATYLYQDGTRVWYGTRPTVTKLAKNLAEQLRREPDKVAAELEKRLRANLHSRGDFTRIHPLPRTNADVPDSFDAGLIVLSAEHAYSKGGNSPAEVAAKAILESRGTAPRLYRNTLVFLAPDATRMADLEQSIRKFLAWSLIVVDKDAHDLSQPQRQQAESQMRSTGSAASAQLPETYRWLLVPEQNAPDKPIVWEAIRLVGDEPLAARASKKLKSVDSLVSALGSTILRDKLNDIPLWRGNHVAVKQLIDDFSRYLYLPRLVGPEVLLNAIRDGVALLTWRKDAFAYAESYDEGAARYIGLRAGGRATIAADGPGLLVKPEVAAKQLDAEVPSPRVPAPAPRPNGEATPSPAGANSNGVAGPSAPRLRRFHGSVRVDPARVGRDAGRIAEEVIAHLAGQMGADVTVTIEIDAKFPNGASDKLVRTVTENSRTLKFESQGFETE